MFDSEEFDDPTQGFGPYKVINCGVNSQGNFFCSHRYHDSRFAYARTYHYINTDGSTYFLNPDGSTVYNNGKGLTKYDDGNGGGYTEINGERVYKASVAQNSEEE